LENRPVPKKKEKEKEKENCTINVLSKNFQDFNSHPFSTCQFDHYNTLQRKKLGYSDEKW